MLHERWERMRLREPCAALRETTAVLASPTPRPYDPDAGYQNVLAAFACEGEDPAPGLSESLAAIDRFTGRFGDETRSAKRIVSRVSRYLPNADEQLEVYARLRKSWTEGEVAERVALMTAQAEGVGKPFELAFENALDGTRFDMSAQRGKVVLIDFWATWCGPCRAELPHLKEIYAKYRGAGLEVIGVALDDGGAEAMKDFCVAQGMAWPQYYQGARWDAPFSHGWGVTSIPRVFLVGRDGKLRSVSARGRLEELVPKLLAESPGGAGAQRSPSSSR